jgi:hypothetical protein
LREKNIKGLETEVDKSEQIKETSALDLNLMNKRPVEDEENKLQSETEKYLQAHLIMIIEEELEFLLKEEPSSA